jgi:hypothetical protein
MKSNFDVLWIIIKIIIIYCLIGWQLLITHPFLTYDTIIIGEQPTLCTGSSTVNISSGLCSGLTLESGTPVHALIQLWTDTSAGIIGAFLYHSFTNFFSVTPSETTPHATSFCSCILFPSINPISF